jgi:GNAT superfamily N-acetyltransferase
MPASLKEGFVDRGVMMEDLKALVDLLNDYWEPLFGMRKITLEEARTALSTPGFDLESSARLILSPEGKLAGFALVLDIASPPVHPQVLGCVGAGFEGQGLGTYLLEWAEKRARNAIARVPAGARVSMYVDTAVGHKPTRRLFEKLGLVTVRFSLFMMAGLEERPPDPRWPDGISISTYQERPDLQATYRAVQEAFQDSWGYVSRDEEEGLKRWQHLIDTDEEFDPSLWFLAMDGDEIAAVARCDPRTGEDRETGFVSILAVRRPWRRRGLALALLHHVFGEFWRRGHKRVGLGVDAQSLTGATRLYEKAGMRAVQRMVTYEKELRPGEELSTQALAG